MKIPRLHAAIQLLGCRKGGGISLPSHGSIGAALVALATPLALAGNDVLLNPGFEDGTNAWKTTDGSANYRPDSTTKHSGAVAIKGVETNPGSLGRLFQNVSSQLLVGQTYQIGGWIKTEGVVGGAGAVIALNYVDARGAVPADGNVRTVGSVAGTKDWTFFQSQPFVLPARPADAVALYFLLDFSAASGTAWFDDLTLSGPTVPISPTASFVDKGLQLSFSTASNRVFSVMASTNLAISASSWNALGRPIENPLGHYSFVDTNTVKQPQKFYFVR